MTAKALKERAKKLSLRAKGKHEFIRTLILEGFFDTPVTSPALILRVKERFGKKLKPNHVQTYMQKFMMEGIIQAIKKEGLIGNLWVLSSVLRAKALKLAAGGSKAVTAESELFSESLVKKLKRNFNVELEDLQLNFGKSGNCTAFLLRKVLEKLIYISFNRNRLGSKLEDRTKPGGLVGLETMINSASSEKIHGAPFLTSKTAREIKGIKFLGDVSAHNPLVDVDIKTIIPQMPYIITAYKELARKL
ncbi:MAG: hypothetical protein AAB402_02355 [Patescibacteria group bacterium]